MLRTVTELVNLYVPPPPQPAPYYKKVRRVTEIDLNTGHRHVVEEKDWTPDGASEQELAAAASIGQIKPPREVTRLAAPHLDETPEACAARTGQPAETDPSMVPASLRTGAMGPTGSGPTGAQAHSGMAAHQALWASQAKAGMVAPAAQDMHTPEEISAANAAAYEATQTERQEAAQP